MSVPAKNASLIYNTVPTRKILGYSIFSRPVKTFCHNFLFFTTTSVVTAEMTVVICEDDKKANLLLDQSPRCLRKLITIKEVSPSTHQRAKSRGVEIIKFTDVEVQGAHKDHPCVVSRQILYSTAI